MKTDYRQLFQPEIINSVSGLALIARVIVDEFLSGSHQSRRVGPGQEFSQYRGYQPGDDMRLLDWKMLARSGRYYIKESDIDTQVNVKFIVDTSASMLHEENGMKKIDFVRVLVASLAHLSHNQGDKVGLYALNSSGLRSVYPESHKRHFNRILYELIEMKVGGEWPSTLDDLEKIHQRTQKELLFVITDMHEIHEELTHWIQNVKTSRNEVVVLHILGENELEFKYTGALVFEDLETGKKVKVNAENARNSYLKSLEASLLEMKNDFLTRNISYELLSLKNPIAEALQLFLKKRIALN
ncbi:DUF58 domain-containing protein [Maribacter cobaltidurans]|uniref:DUF58 domain-containing protein n=1 Tax=Maribacter cobaltidurans TaxID=1178778 RepID=A0A223V5Q8_9FLAO|nr:DUF58 domain-containing protein [Maribacter cobaltidurans]ASV30642.1 DUF58 domain-containing protein [Maribacter cobaltidurans]GGD80510.1 hypothetical protein GCM10011412_17860 [Maribacter cobaltidurans]